MTMKFRAGAFLFCAAVGIGHAVPVSAAESLGHALVSGKVSGDFVLRYEEVDQEGFSKDGEAFTLRGRLGYATAPFRGWSLFGELESVLSAGDHYNSTVNGAITYPVIADPEDTELNQLFLAYRGATNQVILGRQRMILDNARFIGNVGWRQNEQTFDALRWGYTGLSNTSLTYSYIKRAHRIFSDRNPIGNADMNSHLFNASVSGVPGGTLTGYAYLLGFNDSPGAGIPKAAGIRTYGVRYAGKRPLSDPASVSYAVEYATQDDYDDGASTNDADYQLAELGFQWRATGITAGFERLEGDGVYGFATPLATGHKFQGWADKFLATPADGVEDLYLGLGGTLMGVQLQAIYHRFTSDHDSYDFGDEINLLAVKNFGNGYKVGLKYADYDADSDPMNLGITATDAKKIWLWVEYAL